MGITWENAIDYHKLLSVILLPLEIYFQLKINLCILGRIQSLIIFITLPLYNDNDNQIGTETLHQVCLVE